jgi:hypothetical protein
MKLEAEKLARIEWRRCGWKERLRKLKVVTPVGAGLHCLFLKGAIFDGRAGLFYSLQRAFSEMLLSLYLIEQEQQQETLKERAPSRTVTQPQ